MPAEHVVVVAALVFLGLGGLGLAASVRRGRALCEQLAQRLPEKYAELGSPRPGYFDSPRRNAYLRLVMQRDFADIGDPHLVAELERLHRSEMRQFVFLLAGFAALGAAAAWLRWLRPG